MTKQLYTLIGILLCSTALAQNPNNSLCLGKGPEANSIDFKANEVASFLHLSQYKIVLFGEMHNGSFNPEFEYHLITMLNRHCGIRHMFMEMSVSTAWHINQYLATGDTSYLLHSSGQWAIFMQRIFTYSKSLPEDLKLVFHGVDFERTEVFNTIMQLAPSGGNPPLSLQPVMDTVAHHLSDKPLAMYDIVDGKMIEYDNSGFVNALRFIQSGILAHPEDAKSYFGANYAVIKDIAENNGRVEVMPRHRNKTMFDAMQRAIKQQKIEKFMGIFGGEHTAYSRTTSISNAVRKLPGINSDDILNIEEVVYNLHRQTDGKLVEVDNMETIMALNGTCKATIIPAESVPGYGRRADFVVVADAAK